MKMELALAFVLGITACAGGLYAAAKLNRNKLRETLADNVTSNLSSNINSETGIALTSSMNATMRRVVGYAVADSLLEALHV